METKLTNAKNELLDDIKLKILSYLYTFDKGAERVPRNIGDIFKQIHNDNFDLEFKNGILKCMTDEFLIESLPEKNKIDFSYRISCFGKLVYEKINPPMSKKSTTGVHG